MKRWVPYLPIFLAALLLVTGGIVLLGRADRQARDTIRKHHLEDIERSLYAARSVRGTYPPYDQATWCGIINASENKDVRDQIEEALRTYRKQYAHPAKPFPHDPVHNGEAGDYFYWKRSPSSFELYAILEEDSTGERNTSDCPSVPLLVYDYGIASIQRENTNTGTVISSPL